MIKNKWILPYLKQYRSLLLLSIVLGALTILCGGALMFTSGYLISISATMPESILMVYVPIVGVRTFGIGRAVLSYSEKMVGHQYVLKILSQMRIQLYKITEPQALFIHSRFRTGDILGVLSDDIEHLQDFYLKTLFPAITSLLVYSVIIMWAGLFSIPYAILLACLIGLILIVGPFVSFLFVRAKNEKLKHGRNQLYQQFTEAVFGISDWILSGHTKTFIQRYEKQELELLKVEAQKQSFVNSRDIVNQLILGTIVIISIYCVSSLTVSGEIPPTLIAAFALVLLSLLESFLPIADAISETTSYQESIKRLDMIQLKNETKQEMLTSDISNTQIMIECNNVSFGYSDKLLLKDLTIKIGQGERLAVIGRSGAGKSTLLKLIQGVIVPARGDVKLNGKIAQGLHPSISKKIGVLNQNPYLFNTSVLNNIRLGNLDASDEEVHEAAKMVQLDEMIKELPQGYDTNMQETGQRFSGGERQRIALARILLQKAPVVILDEPTVGLDPITEIKLLRTMFDTLKGKTIIWVTHHLVGVEKMDRILFLENGKIAMEGNHFQLLEKEERYRRLYKLDCPF